jgi:hypothetical protein
MRQMAALGALLALLSGGGRAATLEVCRAVSVAEPLAPLTVPAGSLFRDNGRADDPLAAFNGDKWQLRLETIATVVIPSLRACTRVLVRITSDSSVKSVSFADTRTFLYAGSSLLLDRPVEAEELLSTKGRVIDQVP